ncbi:MAG: TlpA family protein disulfide reductase [Candidatus Margulisbacteria bacterium]|nr:TlpA family protein disulfide reductase [Candidatus Margulisiibacteriota bacterium]
MTKKILVIALIVLLTAPVWAKPAAKVGSECPSFSLPTLSGEIINLDKYLGKNSIILSFFTSWSKSCVEETIFLEELHDKYHKKGLQVIGISFDRKGNKLASFISKNGLKYSILHDKKLKTLKKFRILIIPTLLVIDKKGNIKSIYVDFDKNVKESVAEEIKNLLIP